MRSKASQFPPDLAALSARAKALSHPARLAILRILAARQTCICDDLTSELPLAQSTVSQHLKVLKEAGLIEGEVDGPRVCYCIDAATLSALRDEMVGFLDGLGSECC